MRGIIHTSRHRRGSRPATSGSPKAGRECARADTTARRNNHPGSLSGVESVQVRDRRPDGMIWATESGTNRIARVSPSTSSITEFAIPTVNSVPWGITAGTDGNLYFTESGPGKVGRITTRGQIRRCR